MKKILLVLATLCLFVLPADAKRRLVPPTGGAPAPTKFYDSFSGAGSAGWGVGQTSDDYYTGLAGWSDSSAHTLTKVTVKLKFQGGDISGFNYVVRVWSVSGSNLNTLLGTSAPVTGSNSWSATSVDFAFSTTVSLSASTNYHITIDRGGVDNLNYATGYYIGPQIASGNLAIWRSDKSNVVDASSNNFQMQFWGTTP